MGMEACGGDDAGEEEDARGERIGDQPGSVVWGCGVWCGTGGEAEAKAISMALNAF